MRLSILVPLIVCLSMMSVSCSKKRIAVSSPEQSVNNDTVVKIAPTVFVPYTDTFIGSLRVRYLCVMCSCGDYDNTATGYYFYVRHTSTDSLEFKAMDDIYGGPCAWMRREIDMAFPGSISGQYSYSSTHFVLSGDSLHVNWWGDGNTWKSTGGAGLDEAYISFEGVRK